MYLTTNENGERLLVTSASDLTRAAECEFRVARDLEAKLGRLEPIADEPDAMLARTATMGDAHEAAIIADYRAKAAHPDDVLEIDRAAKAGLDAIEPFAAQTLDALQRGAPVIVQATFVDREHSFGEAGELPIAFVGFADFLVRTPEGAYRVLDSKLARRAKVTALLQLAAYAEQLERLGVAVDPEVALILGTGEHSIHRLDDIAPVLRARRSRLHRLLRDRAAAEGPIAWRDPSVTYCRSCAWCESEIAAHDDVSQVAGLTGAQWSKLGAAGIETLAQLATSTSTVNGIAASTLDTLRLQAALQHEAAGATAGTLPPVRVRDAAPLHALPPASPGDLFFDFEGDPLYTEHDPTVWGLDYLFGMVDVHAEFTPYWAHSFADERDALIAFLADVETRRRAHPDLYVYHYAAYERTHLRSLTARHGVGEDIVDEWLRGGVLVDLYPVVTRALRLGTPNYSIKSLEKIYWPEARAGADLARGDDSVAMYVDARSASENGRSAEADGLLATIAEYNRVDCVSTLRLAAWLRGLAAEHPAPAPTLGDDDAADDEAEDDPGPRLDDSPLRTALLELAANADGMPSTEPDRTPEQRAYAYAAAAIDYHRREHKTFWWEHFDRLVADPRDWADVRDVFMVDPDAPHQQSSWGKSGKQRSLRRTLTLYGTWAAGSRPTVSPRSGPFAVYNQPGPMPSNNHDRLARSTRAVALEKIGEGWVVVTETLADGVDEYTELPIALTPASPPNPGQQKPAIEEWGARLVDAAATSSPPEWPAEPVGDLLRRVPPRTRSGATLAQVADDSHGEPDRVSAVVASLLDLDRSYLAVQGPPGTGKTYLGSHVIARLVSKHGWKVGVVAQSHTTVEHVLEGIVEAGLDSRLVGKAPKSSADPADYATARYTVLGKADDVAAFAAGRAASGNGGYVIGGTAWDFASPKRVGRRSLDLLVIDEAGQFSLAATIAASMAAKNLLLLGDPQQLPQVSQGTHPEPIDGSALGYLSAGHDVLPVELGYFLAESRRLHPA
ncbi:MAG: TM0106 family RecB-like putative nuclease [Microcella sp.]|uniref:TM0106 family RecB-like putative nuclease n=1 Tax=Microcella sp. TaxID=1913979 RepID=UPI00331487BC